jgi:hypothetical protein
MDTLRDLQRFGLLSIFWHGRNFSCHDDEALHRAHQICSDGRKMAETYWKPELSL